MNLYNIWKNYFHFYSFSKNSIAIQSSNIMVDTVNVSRQMERNKQLGVKDFYLVQLAGGEVEFSGDILTYFLNDRLFICRSTYKSPRFWLGIWSIVDKGFITVFYLQSSLKSENKTDWIVVLCRRWTFEMNFL